MVAPPPGGSAAFIDKDVPERIGCEAFDETVEMAESMEALRPGIARACACGCDGLAAPAMADEEGDDGGEKPEVVIEVVEKLRLLAFVGRAKGAAAGWELRPDWGSQGEPLRTSSSVARKASRRSRGDGSEGKANDDERGEPAEGRAAW